MANPVEDQEALNNGDGTATTRYDDGSSVTWRIDTGAYVSSTPAGGGGTAPTTLAGTTGGGTGGFNYGASLGNYPGTQYGTPWNNPMSIGAGTSSVPYGYGVPGFGQAPIQIQSSNLPYLSNPQLAPGYIPGSGTYNQYDLSKGTLFGPIGPKQVISNLNYGVGGPGDPTTGKEPQTPQEWLNGPKAFGWYGNMGTAETGTQGLDYIATLFGRPDAGRSGISTAAWSAPDQFWAGLAEAVQSGKIKASAFGLKALAAKGYNVTPPGGPADLEAEFGVNTAAAGGSGGGSGGGQNGAGGGDSALQDYYATITANEQAKQAAELAYRDWQMRTGDDEQAFRHAQQTYENKWNEQMQAYQEKKDQWMLQQSAGYFDVNGVHTPTLAGIAQEASLTGMYQGKPTFQREQYETGTMQNLLGLQASLRGPENYGQYLKVLGSTPQGMRDVVNSAAGRFTMPSTTGVNGQPRSADVQSLVNDVGSGAPGAQAEWQSALSGGLPAPNQINLANWGKMLPSQQKMLQSAYETEGWDVNDFNAMLRQSAPVGAGGKTGTYRF